MSDLNDKLREIQELLRLLCEEHGIEFYANTYSDDDDEVPKEVTFGVWYPSRSDC
jgi:hypothetical protein